MQGCIFSAPIQLLMAEVSLILFQEGEYILVRVEKRPGESEAQMFRRFKRRVLKSQTLSTIRKKRWYVSKSEQRRIDKKKAIRRAQKKKRNRRY